MEITDEDVRALGQARHRAYDDGESTWRVDRIGLEAVVPGIVERHTADLRAENERLQDLVLRHHQVYTEGPDGQRAGMADVRSWGHTCPVCEQGSDS
jgi:hypothetical protein